MRIERIEDLSDPRVADYRGIKDGDLAVHRAGGEARFMGEGELVVRRLIASRFAVESALVSDKRLEGLRDALERMPTETPVYVAAQGVMDQIVGFHIHRGVLAIGRRGVDASVDGVLRSLGAREQPRMVVLLEDIANHDNMGGVFRNAAALGADAVLLTSRCCDPMYRKAIRVSMGTVLRTPFAWTDDAGSGIAALRAAGFGVLALTPSADAVDIAEFGRSRPAPKMVALALGAEGPGLTERAMAAADERVRIAMAEGVDSLNVATASAVAMFALRAARGGEIPARGG